MTDAIKTIQDTVVKPKCEKQHNEKSHQSELHETKYLVHYVDKPILQSSVY